MKHFVYILQSEKDGGYYTGYTANLKRRLEDHNAGRTRSLRGRRRLRLVYVEECPSQAAAKRREQQIKSYKGGEAFQRLLGLPAGRPDA